MRRSVSLLLTLSMLPGLLPWAPAAPAEEQAARTERGGMAVRAVPGLTEPTPLTGT